MRRAKTSHTGSLTNSLELTLTHSIAHSDTPSSNHTVTEEPVSLSDGELLQDKVSPRKVSVYLVVM